MMRMVCDTNYILNPDHRACPKLAELEKILEECRDNPEVKVIVFSEWERMLELARDLCDRLKLGFAWHTGTVPQKRRRAEINAFKSDPHCRVFLSTDSGAAGLNLQNASVVINCDLPWNPAKLEQRIARAWRKHQTRPVTVINLVSENTIEHRMLETLSNKQALADGVLDRKGNLKEIKLQTAGRPSWPSCSSLSPHRRKAGNPKRARPSLPCLPTARGALPRRRASGSTALCCVARSAIPTTARIRCSTSWSSATPRNTASSSPPCTRNTSARANRTRWPPCAWKWLTARRMRRCNGSLRPACWPRPPAPPARSGPRNPRKPPRRRSRPPNGRSCAAHRQQAARKLKMARVLSDGGLNEEARAALLEGLLPSRLCAGRRETLPGTRLARPGHCCRRCLPGWKEALPLLREFTADAARPCPPVLQALAPFASPQAEGLEVRR